MYINDFFKKGDMVVNGRGCGLEKSGYLTLVYKKKKGRKD